ncbi:MAG: hypothetical protein QOE65_1464 [Solirubrobacteraceae bacterium]|jgi:hypothetical protein|nr:hypothetical protein [Solirubrobacteraceae bacterium]
MNFLRYAAFAALSFLALPTAASAAPAKFRAVMSASQVTTWRMDRQYDPAGCTWRQGHGRETVRLRGAGLAFAHSVNSGSAGWTYGGERGLRLAGVSLRSNYTTTGTQPATPSTTCGPATSGERVAVRCGTRHGAVFGRLDWTNNMFAIGLRDPNRVLAFANCPIFTPRGVTSATLTQIAQRARNVLSVRFLTQTMKVRRTFNSTVTDNDGRRVDTTTVVRWQLALHRFGAHR